MPYCSASDVRLIINTSLSDAQIDTVIELSDAEIDKRLGSRSASDKLIKKLSMLLTAHTIKTRQPQSQAIGAYKENAGNVLEVWEREIDRIFQLYKGATIKVSEYQHIDEDARYPE